MICAEAKLTASRPDAQKRVDLHAGDRIAVTGNERRRARDIGTGLADRVDHAQHYVIDHRGIEVVAALDGAERLARQIERGHLVERAVHLAAAARGAHVIVDKRIGHGRLREMMTSSPLGEGGQAAGGREAELGAGRPSDREYPSI